MFGTLSSPSFMIIPAHCVRLFYFSIARERERERAGRDRTMEVVVSGQGMGFDLRSSPPSTPRRMGEFYFSAPCSPTRLAQLYREVDQLLAVERPGSRCPSATVPFSWEIKPGTPKSPAAAQSGVVNEDDFAFDLSGEFQMVSLSAGELFEGGMIRPLKPQPGLQNPVDINEPFIPKSPSSSSPRSPESPFSRGKNIIRGGFSPRGVKRDPPQSEEISKERERGRERAISLTSSSRRGTRSVSPLRISKYPWEEEHPKQQLPQNTPTRPPSSSTSTALVAPTSKWSRKWRLRDLFLFRSASDGRAMEKDPFMKYTTLRSSTLRSTEGSGSRRRDRVSAHELHYTVNRAVAEDMKKRTFLPYKQGILGRLAFNPTVHALANGFGFSRK